MAIQSWGSSPIARAGVGTGMDWGPVMDIDPNSYAPDMGNAASSLQNLPSFTVGQSGSGSGSMFGGIGDWMNNSGFLGKTMANGDKVQGWGMPVMGAIGGLASSYLGYQQLKLAKDSLAENKRQFGMNWGAQQKTVNSRLEDRQRARVASNSGAYASVDDYMKKNGI